MKVYRTLLKTSCFYIFYYFVIFGLTVSMFWLANFLVLLRDMPILTGEQSVLRLRPGLSVLPRPDSLTSLIKYEPGKLHTMRSYMNDLLSFTQQYERYIEKSRLVDCSKNRAYKDHPKFSCKFPLDIGFVGCNIYKQFGYNEASPCFLVRINRIIGWLPQLKKQQISLNESHKEGFPTIKIKCDGVYESDKENMGKVCYYDEESLEKFREKPPADQEAACSYEYGQIRNYYYPYKKQFSYQTPFVWVKLFNIKRHVIVMVQCWAEADNINADAGHGEGFVKFEVLAD